jgi:hypothetical protein
MGLAINKRKVQLYALLLKSQAQGNKKDRRLRVRDCAALTSTTAHNGPGDEVARILSTACPFAG